MLATIKHTVDDSFVFQQHSAPVHGASNTVQLLQHETINIISAKLLPQTAQSSTQLITRFRELYSSMKLWVASKQYWRNQAVTSWSLARHQPKWKDAVFTFPYVARLCRSSSLV